MSIRISNTSIHFGNFTLTANTEGFSFDGKIRAKRGFVDSSVPNAQGVVSGYHAGGGAPPLSPSYTNIIDKFPFSTDTNATDVGDLSLGVIDASGQSSKVSGYVSGGAFDAPGNTATNTIQKFPFSVDANGTDVGDITQARQSVAGQSSDISGYVSAGLFSNIIEKFPFATDTNATDVGDITQTRQGPAGQSSSISGYNSGGSEPPTPSETNRIDKFPFATDTNATDVGDLTQSKRGVMGQSSKVSGYTSGGFPGNVNVIDKFPFAVDGNASDVGDLTQGRGFGSSQSSTTNGYATGGYGATDRIDKFPFATDTNATDVGNLTVGRGEGGGNQN